MTAKLFQDVLDCVECADCFDTRAEWVRWAKLEANAKLSDVQEIANALLALAED